MGVIEKWVDRISYWCSFWALVAMMVLILVEVVIRGLFGISTLIAQEYSAYVLIFFVFICLAHVLKKNRHIKIVILTSRLPLRTRNILDVAMYSLTLLLIVYLFYWSIDMTLDAVEIGERAETVAATPLAVPKAFIPFGCFFFILQLIVAIQRKIKNISSPDGEGNREQASSTKEAV